MQSSVILVAESVANNVRFNRIESIVLREVEKQQSRLVSGKFWRRLECRVGFVEDAVRNSNGADQSLAFHDRILKLGCTDVKI
jgi:hypothetical protein